MVDIINIEDASTTAANNLAVAGISDAEGWLPSTVNNFTRASWAVLAKFYDDFGGVVTVAGTADAITFTTTGTHTALTTGLRIRAIAGSTNTTAVTINLDAIGAKAGRKIVGGTDAALAAGDIRAGKAYDWVYDATANALAGAWIMQDPIRPVVDGGTGASTAAGALTNLGVTAAAQTILDDTSVGAIRTTLGVGTGDNPTFNSVTATNGVSTNGVVSTGAVSSVGFSNNSATATFTYTDAGASGGPTIILQRISASPAAADTMGAFLFQGRDSGGNNANYSLIQSLITDPTDASEDAKLEFYNSVAGTITLAGSFGAGLFMSGAADPGAGNIAAVNVSVSSGVSASGGHFSLASGNKVGTAIGTGSEASIAFTANVITTLGSVVVGAPTGGAKGGGTVNALAVYDDNVLLTAYPIDAYLDGTISEVKWDNKVANRVIPAKPETKVQRTELVEVEREDIEIVDGPAVRRMVKEQVERPVFETVPVVDEAGNPVIIEVSPAIAAIPDEVDEEGKVTKEGSPAVDAVFVQRTHQVPVYDTVPAEPEIVVERRHEDMRKFKARLGSDTNPLDLEKYIAHWKKKRHLTSLPNEEKFDIEKGLSTGSWIQRLVETVEIQAIHISQLHDRLKSAGL